MFYPIPFVLILDRVGSLLGFTAVMLFVRGKIIGWPISIVGLLIDIILYFSKGLYADTFLNFIYLALAIWGWKTWAIAKSNQQEFVAEKLNTKELRVLFGIFLVLFVLFFEWLAHFTNSTVPYSDALTTALSLIAQWLACRKYLENWYVWILADSIYIGMYFYKGIPAHALLNFIYLGLALMGYLRWRKTLAPTPATLSS